MASEKEREPPQALLRQLHGYSVSIDAARLERRLQAGDGGLFQGSEGGVGKGHAAGEAQRRVPGHGWGRERVLGLLRQRPLQVHVGYVAQGSPLLRLSSASEGGPLRGDAVTQALGALIQSEGAKRRPGGGRRKSHIELSAQDRMYAPRMPAGKPSSDVFSLLHAAVRHGLEAELLRAGGPGPASSPRPQGHSPDSRSPRAGGGPKEARPLVSAPGSCVHLSELQPGRYAVMAGGGLLAPPQGTPGLAPDPPPDTPYLQLNRLPGRVVQITDELSRVLQAPMLHVWHREHLAGDSRLVTSDAALGNLWRNHVASCVEGRHMELRLRGTVRVLSAAVRAAARLGAASEAQRMLPAPPPTPLHGSSMGSGDIAAACPLPPVLQRALGTPAPRRTQRASAFHRTTAFAAAVCGGGGSLLQVADFVQAAGAAEQASFAGCLAVQCQLRSLLTCLLQELSFMACLGDKTRARVREVALPHLSRLLHTAGLRASVQPSLDSSGGSLCGLPSSAAAGILARAEGRKAPEAPVALSWDVVFFALRLQDVLLAPSRSVGASAGVPASRHATHSRSSSAPFTSTGSLSLLHSPPLPGQASSRRMLSPAHASPLMSPIRAGSAFRGAAATLGSGGLPSAPQRPAASSRLPPEADIEREQVLRGVAEGRLLGSMASLHVKVGAELWRAVDAALAAAGSDVPVLLPLAPGWAAELCRAPDASVCQAAARRQQEHARMVFCPVPCPRERTAHAEEPLQQPRKSRVPQAPRRPKAAHLRTLQTEEEGSTSAQGSPPPADLCLALVDCTGATPVTPLSQGKALPPYWPLAGEARARLAGQRHPIPRFPDAEVVEGAMSALLARRAAGLAALVPPLCLALRQTLLQQLERCAIVDEDTPLPSVALNPAAQRTLAALNVLRAAWARCVCVDGCIASQLRSLALSSAGRAALLRGSDSSVGMSLLASVLERHAFSAAPLRGAVVSEAEQAAADATPHGAIEASGAAAYTFAARPGERIPASARRWCMQRLVACQPHSRLAGRHQVPSPRAAALQALATCVLGDHAGTLKCLAGAALAAAVSVLAVHNQQLVLAAEVQPPHTHMSVFPSEDDQPVAGQCGHAQASPAVRSQSVSPSVRSGGSWSTGRSPTAGSRWGTGTGADCTEAHLVTAPPFQTLRKYGAVVAVGVLPLPPSVLHVDASPGGEILGGAASCSPRHQLLPWSMTTGCIPCTSHMAFPEEQVAAAGVLGAVTACARGRELLREACRYSLGTVRGDARLGELPQPLTCLLHTCQVQYPGDSGLHLPPAVSLGDESAGSSSHSRRSSFSSPKHRPRAGTASGQHKFMSDTSLWSSHGFGTLGWGSDALPSPVWRASGANQAPPPVPHARELFPEQVMQLVEWGMCQAAACPPRAVKVPWGLVPVHTAAWAARHAASLSCHWLGLLGEEGTALDQHSSAALRHHMQELSHCWTSCLRMGGLPPELSSAVELAASLAAQVPAPQPEQHTGAAQAKTATQRCTWGFPVPLTTVSTWRVEAQAAASALASVQPLLTSASGVEHWRRCLLHASVSSALEVAAANPLQPTPPPALSPVLLGGTAVYTAVASALCRSVALLGSTWADPLAAQARCSVAWVTSLPLHLLSALCHCPLALGTVAGSVAAERARTVLAVHARKATPLGGAPRLSTGVKSSDQVLEGNLHTAVRVACLAEGCVRRAQASFLCLVAPPAHLVPGSARRLPAPPSTLDEEPPGTAAQGSDEPRGLGLTRSRLVTLARAFCVPEVLVPGCVPDAFELEGGTSFARACCVMNSVSRAAGLIGSWVWALGLRAPSPPPDATAEHLRGQGQSLLRPAPHAAAAGLLRAATGLGVSSSSLGSGSSSLSGTSHSERPTHSLASDGGRSEASAAQGSGANRHVPALWPARYEVPKDVCVSTLHRCLFVPLPDVQLLLLSCNADALSARHRLQWAQAHAALLTFHPSSDPAAMKHDAWRPWSVPDTGGGPSHRPWRATAPPAVLALQWVRSGGLTALTDCVVAASTQLSAAQALVSFLLPHISERVAAVRPNLPTLPSAEATAQQARTSAVRPEAFRRTAAPTKRTEPGSPLQSSLKSTVSKEGVRDKQQVNELFGGRTTPKGRRRRRHRRGGVTTDASGKMLGASQPSKPKPRVRKPDRRLRISIEEEGSKASRSSPGGRQQPPSTGTGHVKRPTFSPMGSPPELGGDEGPGADEPAPEQEPTISPGPNELDELGRQLSRVAPHAGVTGAIRGARDIMAHAEAARRRGWPSVRPHFGHRPGGSGGEEGSGSGRSSSRSATLSTVGGAEDAESVVTEFSVYGAHMSARSHTRTSSTSSAMGDAPPSRATAPVFKCPVVATRRGMQATVDLARIAEELALLLQCLTHAISACSDSSLALQHCMAALEGASPALAACLDTASQPDALAMALCAGRCLRVGLAVPDAGVLERSISAARSLSAGHGLLAMTLAQCGVGGQLLRWSGDLLRRRAISIQAEGGVPEQVQLIADLMVHDGAAQPQATPAPADTGAMQSASGESQTPSPEWVHTAEAVPLAQFVVAGLSAPLASHRAAIFALRAILASDARAAPAWLHASDSHLAQDTLQAAHVTGLRDLVKLSARLQHLQSKPAKPREDAQGHRVPSAAVAHLQVMLRSLTAELNVASARVPTNRVGQAMKQARVEALPLSVLLLNVVDACWALLANARGADWQGLVSCAAGVSPPPGEPAQPFLPHSSASRSIAASMGRHKLPVHLLRICTADSVAPLPVRVRALWCLFLLQTCQPKNVPRQLAAAVQAAPASFGQRVPAAIVGGEAALHWAALHLLQQCSPRDPAQATASQQVQQQAIGTFVRHLTGRFGEGGESVHRAVLGTPQGGVVFSSAQEAQSDATARGLLHISPRLSKERRPMDAHMLSDLPTAGAQVAAVVAALATEPHGAYRLSLAGGLRAVLPALAATHHLDVALHLLRAVTALVGVHEEQPRITHECVGMLLAFVGTRLHPGLTGMAATIIRSISHHPTVGSFVYSAELRTKSKGWRGDTEKHFGLQVLRSLAAAPKSGQADPGADFAALLGVDGSAAVLQSTWEGDGGEPTRPRSVAGYASVRGSDAAGSLLAFVRSKQGQRPLTMTRGQVTTLASTSLPDLLASPSRVLGRPRTAGPPSRRTGRAGSPARPVRTPVRRQRPSQVDEAEVEAGAAPAFESGSGATSAHGKLQAGLAALRFAQHLSDLAPQRGEEDSKAAPLRLTELSQHLRAPLMRAYGQSSGEAGTGSRQAAGLAPTMTLHSAASLLGQLSPAILSQVAAVGAVLGEGARLGCTSRRRCRHVLQGEGAWASLPQPTEDVHSAVAESEDAMDAHLRASVHEDHAWRRRWRAWEHRAAAMHLPVPVIVAASAHQRSVEHGTAGQPSDAPWVTGLQAVQLVPFQPAHLALMPPPPLPTSAAQAGLWGLPPPLPRKLAPAFLGKAQEDGPRRAPVPLHAAPSTRQSLLAGILTRGALAVRQEVNKDEEAGVHHAVDMVSSLQFSGNATVQGSGLALASAGLSDIVSAAAVASKLGHLATPSAGRRAAGLDRGAPRSLRSLHKWHMGVLSDAAAALTASVLKALHAGYQSAGAKDVLGWRPLRRAGRGEAPTEARRKGTPRAGKTALVHGRRPAPLTVRGDVSPVFSAPQTGAHQPPLSPASPTTPPSEELVLPPDRARGEQLIRDAFAAGARTLFALKFLLMRALGLGPFVQGVLSSGTGKQLHAEEPPSGERPSWLLPALHHGRTLDAVLRAVERCISRRSQQQTQVLREALQRVSAIPAHLALGVRDLQSGSVAQATPLRLSQWGLSDAAPLTCAALLSRQTQEAAVAAAQASEAAWREQATTRHGRPLQPGEGIGDIPAWTGLCPPQWYCPPGGKAPLPIDAHYLATAAPTASASVTLVTVPVACRGANMPALPPLSILCVHLAQDGVLSDAAGLDIPGALQQVAGGALAEAGNPLPVWDSCTVQWLRATQGGAVLEAAEVWGSHAVAAAVERVSGDTTSVPGESLRRLLSQSAVSDSVASAPRSQAPPSPTPRPSRPLPRGPAPKTTGAVDARRRFARLASNPGLRPASTRQVTAGSAPALGAPTMSAEPWILPDWLRAWNIDLLVTGQAKPTAPDTSAPPLFQAPTLSPEDARHLRAFLPRLESSDAGALVDTPEVVDAAFRLEWHRAEAVPGGRLGALARTMPEDELARTCRALFPIIDGMYRYYSCLGVDGDPFSMALPAWQALCGHLRVGPGQSIEGGAPLSHTAMESVFVALADSGGMFRHQFLLALLRMAALVWKGGQVGDAVRRLVARWAQGPAMLSWGPHSAFVHSFLGDAYRQRRLYTNRVSELLQRHDQFVALLHRTFARPLLLAGGTTGPAVEDVFVAKVSSGPAPVMSMAGWMSMWHALRLLGAPWLDPRTAALAFTLSRPMAVDELHPGSWQRHTHLGIVDFVEALSRVADTLPLPSDDALEQSAEGSMLTYMRKAEGKGKRMRGAGDGRDGALEHPMELAPVGALQWTTASQQPLAGRLAKLLVLLLHRCELLLLKPLKAARH